MNDFIIIAVNYASTDTKETHNDATYRKKTVKVKKTLRVYTIQINYNEMDNLDNAVIRTWSFVRLSSLVMRGLL